MIKSGIYKIINLVNNKIYIGSSVDLEDRKYDHFKSLKKGNHCNNNLQNSYNKYGKKNFKFEVIEYIEDLTKLIKIEQYYLDTLLFAQEFIKNKDKRFKILGFNICPTAGSRLGKPCSEETKLKMSLSRKGKSPWNKGKSGYKQTENQKIIISKIHKGKIVSEETREKLRKPVLQIDLKTNKIIKEWPYLNIIYDILNISGVHNVCNGHRKSAGGFKWEYKNKTNG